jgi:hypothetical protein
MSENSIDDRYKMPEELIQKSRIDDNFSWSYIRGRPTINTLNNIEFHEVTGDSVSAKNVFNLSETHLEIKCTLPNVPETSFGDFRIGGWNYYGIIRTNGITFYGPNGQTNGPYEFSSGDKYTQYYDSTQVIFKINNSDQTNFLYEIPFNQQNPNLECMKFGFDNADPESSNTIIINDITCFVSGQKGDRGIDGNALITSTGIPDEGTGESGSFYYDNAASLLYGRKSGVGGSLFFDGVNVNDTRLTIPNDDDLRMGTSDFTIEWFQYMTDASYGYVLSMINSESTSGMSISFDQGNPGEGQTLIFNANGNDYPLKFLQYKQRWVHIAITRCISIDEGEGDQYLSLHVDGVFQESSGSSINENIYNTTDPLTIGNIPGDSGDFKGYITNLRIIKGKAIYVSVFDIPKQPLLDISGSTIGFTVFEGPDPTQVPYNTVLLLTADNLTNAFIDTSSKQKTVSNNNVMWDPVTPFQNTGTWNTNPVVVSNKSFTRSLTTSPSVLWDFKENGLKSIVIYLTCAGSDKQPISVSIINVNYGSQGPKYNVVTGLATGVSLGTTFDEGSAQIYATSTTNYPNTRVLIMPIV